MRASPTSSGSTAARSDRRRRPTERTPERPWPASGAVAAPRLPPGSGELAVARAHPGLLRLALRLELADGVALEQCQADLVEPLEQALFSEGVDLEAIHLDVRLAHRLLGQVDAQPVARRGVHLGEQAVDGRLVEHDRQQTVLEAVAIEDLGEARRDDRSDAPVGQRPGRVLTARAATEVGPGEQDVGPGIARLVERKLQAQRALGTVLVGLAAVEVAPLVEQVRTEA